MRGILISFSRDKTKRRRLTCDQTQIEEEIVPPDVFVLQGLFLLIRTNGQSLHTLTKTRWIVQCEVLVMM